MIKVMNNKFTKSLLFMSITNINVTKLKYVIDDFYR